MGEVGKYRKQPVVIDAVRFGRDGFDLDREARLLAAWCGGKADTRDAAVGGAVPVVVIDTLEGTMVAYPGDWIIKGVQGEFYPCKPGIFDATYEKVESTDAP